MAEGYPKDVVPLYDGAVMDVSGKALENGQTVFSLSYHVKASVKDVYNYYVDVMKDATELNKIETGEFNGITGIKQDMQIVCHISKYSGDETQSQVDITIESGAGS